MNKVSLIFDNSVIKTYSLDDYELSTDLETITLSNENETLEFDLSKFKSVDFIYS